MIDFIELTPIFTCYHNPSIKDKIGDGVAPIIFAALFPPFWASPLYNFLCF